MRSNLTEDFRACYEKLPENVRQDARAAYRLFKRDAFANSLRFKEV